MSYGYIERAYGVAFKPKMRVRHTVTHKLGEVRRPGNMPGHYVSVRFDGEKHNLPCHPKELDIVTAGNWIKDVFKPLPEDEAKTLREFL